MASAMCVSVVHFGIMILPSPRVIRICYIGTARLIRTRLHRSSRPPIIAPGLSWDWREDAARILGRWKRCLN